MEHERLDSADTPNSHAPSASASQQPDWEARYKGQQTEYNRLRAEYERLKQELEAKNSANAELASKLRDWENRLSQTARDYETRLAQAQAEVKSILEEKERIAQEREALAAVARKAEMRESTRKAISQINPQLVEWYDSGVLRPYGEDGELLTGDALSDFLAAFASRVAGVAKTAIASTLPGSTPSVPPATSARYNGITAEQLEDWLVKNPRHPDWDRVQEEYLKLIDAK